jgi:hypothetical protein
MWQAAVLDLTGAKTVFLSAERMHFIFKRNLGISPMNYCNRFSR